MPYGEGLEWLPNQCVLTRNEMVELLPALRSLIDALDEDDPALSYAVTIAMVLGRALDREEGGTS